MTLTRNPHFTCCGLPGIDVVPFGMHACHFYRDRDELVAALVPYFVAGLQANERCFWVTAPPLPAREAIQALRAGWDAVDEALQQGTLRILDFDRWYQVAEELKGRDVADLWIGEEERALAEGYEGLRIAGNTSFLKPGDWAAFQDYERAVTDGLLGRRIVALCSYPLEQCDPRRMDDVLRTHECAFELSGTDWQVATATRPNAIPADAGPD